MNYIIESLLVGVYTCFIYLLFSPFIKNFYFLLLVCGFFKHFLGSKLGLWTWYCNNGEACSKVLDKNKNKYKYYEANNKNLISESIYESVIFLVVGTILSLMIRKNIYLFLVMGIILHIVGEKTGIHKSFCMNTCDKID